MVKTITFIKRRAGLDRPEFLAYWRREHAPLVSRLPGLRRQCSNVALAIPGREPRFDLVAEAWWDDREALTVAQASAAGKAVADSLARIADPAQALSLIAAERVIIPPPPAGSFVKTFVTLYRRPDLSFEEFDRYWAGPHGKLASGLPGARGYVQCPALQIPGQTQALDGCPIVWFDSLEANRVAVRSPLWPDIRADELNFLDQARMVGLATEEL